MIRVADFLRRRLKARDLLCALLALTIPFLPFQTGAQENEPHYGNARKAYVQCLFNYALSKIAWNATAGDLADAAAHECRNLATEILKVRLKSEDRPTIAQAFDSLDRAVESDRRELIHAILELRNAEKLK